MCGNNHLALRPPRRPMEHLREELHHRGMQVQLRLLDHQGPVPSITDHKSAVSRRVPSEKLILSLPARI